MSQHAKKHAKADKQAARRELARREREAAKQRKKKQPMEVSTS